MGLYTAEVRISFLIVSFCLYIVGLCGNSLIIWTFLRTKRLRIVQNVFVILLAIVDLNIIGILLPFTMYILISNEKPRSRVVCRLFGILTNMLFTFCLQFIMCIAVSRYVKICHSNKFTVLFTRRKVVLLILCCVLYWLAFLVPLVIHDDYIIFEQGLHMCNFDRFKHKIFANVYVMFCLVIPISVTSVCYIKTYIYIRKAKYQLYKNWNNGLARQRIMYELTVTRSQFAVFVAYLILYFPFGISTIVGPNPDVSLSWINTAASYMGFTNSCINSLLYGLLNRNIREAYFEVLPCLMKKRKMRIHPLNERSAVTKTTVV